MLQRLLYRSDLFRSQQQRLLSPVLSLWNLHHPRQSCHTQRDDSVNNKKIHTQSNTLGSSPQLRFFSTSKRNLTNTSSSSKSEDFVIPSSWIRLSKRLSELDICSRREADRLIRSGKVVVDGQVAMLAEKVPPNLGKDQISIRRFSGDDDDDDNYSKGEENHGSSSIMTTTVVLNKPLGYVSGQAEHDHLPAIRLLTRDRLWESKEEGSSATSATTNDSNTLLLPSSWKGYAPAGRLDLHSTGLLVFSSAGVVAKKLIHHNSSVSKEYIVDVEPALQVSKREKELNPDFDLPKPPSTDLTPLLEGGRTLLGSEHKPLLPCMDAEWIEEGRTLRLVLMEGRKHHIRRLCREVLGYHVVKLQRVRIGPIELGDLPEGCWRPVSQEELDGVMQG